MVVLAAHVIQWRRAPLAWRVMQAASLLPARIQRGRQYDACR